MNCVNLIGNLALDPELRKTNGGKDVCTIRVGVTRDFSNANGVRESDFVNIQCWEQTARFVAQYLHKGDMIAVTGELRERNYTSKTGENRYTMEVLATRVKSLSRRGEQRTEEKAPTANARTGFTEIDDDDLPF